MPQLPRGRVWDAIIVGAGHNGLVASAYLARKGCRVLVLERRPLLGGAACTEELIPGFHFSRASYVAGLLRPQIVKDLGLETKHGLRFLPRDPSSYTPTRAAGQPSLMIGSDLQATCASIAQFSKRDAVAYPAYEAFLSQAQDLIAPLLNGPLPSPRDGWHGLQQGRRLLAAVVRHRAILPQFYELLTAPATHILDRYFESQILKTTLATDAVIGAMHPPSAPGSGYLLLHHCMGEVHGRKGVWAYVQGGMGSVSQAIADAARDAGADICTDVAVDQILVHDGCASGVRLADGTELTARTVLSNATPYHTFVQLLQQHTLPAEFLQHVHATDYSCGVMKINLAVTRLPVFRCLPDLENQRQTDLPGPQHHGTIHFSNTVHELEAGYAAAAAGRIPEVPVVEMTIPSALDPTVAPPGKHTMNLFVQYVPYHLTDGSWDDAVFKQSVADRVYSVIESFCPGFTDSILGADVLSPVDLERVFGLHQGSITHGALSLHQIGYMRPAPHYSDHRTPVRGLYLCGAGAHPGGGVMGAAGKHCAEAVLRDRIAAQRLW